MPQGRCADIVMKLRPDAADPGEIFDLDGNVIKTHDGFVNFTVGQRKDLGIGGRQDADGEDSEPLYVIRIEPEARRVFAGPKSAPAKTVENQRVFLAWRGRGWRWRHPRYGAFTLQPNAVRRDINTR